MTKRIEGSFIAIVAKEARPYENYPHVEKRVADMNIPIVFMINRWDGKIGFPGGMVEEGETPLVAAIREAKEEIGLELTEDQLEFVVTTTESNEKRDLVTHLYAHFVSYEELINIGRRLTLAEHFGSEATGFVMIQCIDGKKPIFSNFLKNHFPPTAKEQLEALVASYDLVVEEG